MNRCLKIKEKIKKLIKNNFKTCHLDHTLIPKEEGRNLI